MISYFGDFAEDDTVNIPFNTFDSNDPSASVTITNLADADIHVHKDGSTTQAVTDGATVVIDFDGITGNHMITIDTSAHAYYATGSEYSVRIEGTTVDAGTINAWVGSFSIERAGGVLAVTKLIQAAVITNAAGTDVAADIIAVKAETALIVADTDLIDDGTSGLAKIATDVAAVLVDTGTTLDTKLNDVQGATFSSATDSLEALRNRGDSAWTGSATTSNAGTAQAGAAGSITLESGASATDNLYNGQVVFISAGTGAGQSRAIDGYTGSSKVATVITNWVTNPSSDSVYEVTPDDVTEVTAAPSAAANADAVWDENTAGHTSAGTFGEQCKNDIDAILVDTAVLGTAAGADLGADIAAIKADTGPILVDTAVIGALGAGLTALSTQASVDTIGTNVDAILVDTGTTLQAELDAIQAAVITNAAGADVAADIIAVKADTAATLVDTGTAGVLLAADQAVDVTKISGNAAAADRLEASSRAAIAGASVTGTLTTVATTSDLTGYADDELIGRVIIWYSGTADGQASDITDYASASGLVTYTAINTAPINGDLFVIV